MEIIADAAVSAIKMAKKIIIFLIGLIPFVLGGLAAFIAKKLLPTQQEGGVSNEYYFLVVCAIIVTSNCLTMFIILGAFRSDLLGTGKLKPNESAKVYRYPYYTIWTPFILSIMPPVAGFTLDNPNKPTPFQGYIVIFALSIIFIFYAVFRAKFQVQIDSMKLTISSFSVKTILIANIAQVRYIWDRGGRSTNIVMNGGKKYTIIRTFKNHYQFVDTLTALVGKGRWTSSDLRITRHFKEVTARATSNEEADRNKESR